MKSLLLTLGILLGLSTSMLSQTDDTLPAQDYDAIEVLSEWKQWKMEATKENAYVGTFMEKYEVPQSGVKNLNREETWYMWISNHPEEIKYYLKMQEEANN